ncbi:ABC transporter substrate-binding protein [Pedobacter cryoconitis]|uniref:Leucine-binding protein domain-containing protein n=1 Tax=Pedobacter cryoconitis TaxID=188932 RepID=A0A7X0J6I0_9SPHI|nr:ABC transporter substrate-binding protein [Pedobacter cryoconitis]MBB6502000.1 hypothetical protein [Pedobacter cryoconitis]
MTIGILLPNSTTYPLISYNFIAGLKGCLGQLAPALLPELHTSSIGFGTDQIEMLKEAQDMLLEKNADILIVFADHPVVECLFPLISSLKKLLIIVNTGAKYPPVKLQPYVIYHTLNYALHCRLTGKFAADQSSKAVNATSYYDGGYSLCHGISDGYMSKGSNIVFNFVSKFKADEFDINPLSDFIQANPEVKDILAVYSDLSPVFYEQLAQKFPATPLNIFANPAMLDEIHLPEDEDFSLSKTVNAYLPWTVNIKNAENINFCNVFKASSGRLPDAFAALGWDTGVLLTNYIVTATANPLFKIKQVLAHLFNNEMNGAKGVMYVDRKTHQVLSPAYRVKLEAENELIVEEVVLYDEVLQEWTEICAHPAQGLVSGWINTYMCS